MGEDSEVAESSVTEFYEGDGDMRARVTEDSVRRAVEEGGARDRERTIEEEGLGRAAWR